MAETMDFTCRSCGAQFDAREKLDQHTRREHGAQGQDIGQQGQKGQWQQGQQAQQGQPRSGDAGTPRREDDGYGQGTQRGGMRDPREREKRADEPSFEEEG